MRLRGSAHICAIAIGAITALTLVGCSAQALPKGPSDEEIDARVAAELDRQWEFTGLDGVVERPVVVDSDPADPFDARIFQCLSDNGFSSWGTDDTGLVMQGREPTTEEQLTYYGCYALYPSIEIFSTDQRDYIYDYYARYLVPCLHAEGYTVTPIPRRTFVGDETGEGWHWSPYQSLDRYPKTVEAFDALVLKCPAALPGVEGWENKPF